MNHIVMFSGGVCSWATAKRVVERHGTAGVMLLFADTKMEDEDLYRFLDEAAMNVGVPLVKVADGRTPWQVFEDVKAIGSTRLDPCSRILKRELLDRWVKDNAPDATLHFGLDWTETHRLVAYAEGGSVTSWSSKMLVVGNLTRAPSQTGKGNNFLGIAYSKAAEMADTLKDSGSGVRPPMTGEYGWQGGVVAKGKSGILIAAFSGGRSEDDVKVSQTGLGVLAGSL